jgi:hypothetical protein
MVKYIIAIAVLLNAIVTIAKDEPPGVIIEFCAMNLQGDIVSKDEPFNSTDIVKKGMRTRRMIDYLVTSTTSFLWYEHGGRGYHQHLVRFNTARPEEIQASYVFISSEHSRIFDLIKDTEFLRSHLSKDREL